jgi:hypothetical protein
MRDVLWVGTQRALAVVLQVARDLISFLEVVF